MIKENWWQSFLLPGLLKLENSTYFLTYLQKFSQAKRLIALRSQLLFCKLIISVRLKLTPRFTHISILHLPVHRFLPPLPYSRSIYHLFLFRPNVYYHKVHVKQRHN